MNIIQSQGNASQVAMPPIQQKKPTDSLSVVQEIIRQCMIFDFLSDKDLASFCPVNKECSLLIERFYYLEQDKAHRRTSYEYVKEKRKCDQRQIQTIQNSIRDIDREIADIEKRIQQKDTDVGDLYKEKWKLDDRRKSLLEEEAKLVPHAPEYRNFQKNSISSHVLNLFGSKRKFLSLPILDISAYDKERDYIDYIYPSRMTASVMRGEDKCKRVFFAVCAKRDNERCVQVFFQRYGNTALFWSDGNAGPQLFSLDGHFISSGEVDQPKNQAALVNLKILIQNKKVKFERPLWRGVESCDYELA